MEAEKQWFQGRPGEISALRIMAMFICVIGGFIAAFGIVGWFTGLPDALAVIGIGAGLMTTSGAVKAIQKRSEVKQVTQGIPAYYANGSLTDDPSILNTLGNCNPDISSNEVLK